MNEYMNIRDAADLLGVHRNHMGRLIRRHNLETYENELDLRERLIRRSDVLAMQQPRREHTHDRKNGQCTEDVELGGDITS